MSSKARQVRIGQYIGGRTAISRYREIICLLNGFDQFAVFRPSNGTWYGTSGSVTPRFSLGYRATNRLREILTATGNSTSPFSDRATAPGISRTAMMALTESNSGASAKTFQCPVDMSRPATRISPSGALAMELISLSQSVTSTTSMHFGQNGDIPQPIDYGTVGGEIGPWNIQAEHGGLVYSRTRRPILRIPVWPVRRCSYRRRLPHPILMMGG